MKTKFTLIIAVVISAATLLLDSCKSYNVASRYTAKYIQTNNGKLSAQVPEAFELGYAMLALTDLAQKDTSVINQNTPYYRELMARFSQYKNLKGVQHLNADLNRNPKLIKSYLDGLYAFKMNNGRFVLRNNYRIDLNKVDFKRYALLLQSFYKETNFHEFYAQHDDLYSEMVQKANNLFIFNELQKNMPGSVKGYQVVLSPLTNTYAGTMQIKGHAYSECIIFPRLSTNGLSYALNNDFVNTPSGE